MVPAIQDKESPRTTWPYHVSYRMVVAVATSRRILATGFLL